MKMNVPTLVVKLQLRVSSKNGGQKANRRVVRLPVRHFCDVWCNLREWLVSSRI
jgi:hypothetical protein